MLNSSENDSMLNSSENDKGSDSLLAVLPSDLHGLLDKSLHR